MTVDKRTGWLAELKAGDTVVVHLRDTRMREAEVVKVLARGRMRVRSKGARLPIEFAPGGHAEFCGRVTANSAALLPATPENLVKARLFARKERVGSDVWQLSQVAVDALTVEQLDILEEPLAKAMALLGEKA